MASKIVEDCQSTIPIGAGTSFYAEAYGMVIALRIENTILDIHMTEEQEIEEVWSQIAKRYS